MSCENEPSAPVEAASSPAAPLRKVTNPTAGGSSVSVFVSGLNNPRGLKFGPDGFLYVAEGGVGGTNSTVGEGCDQVLPPVGPYTGSATGSRISKISPAGERTTVVENLPSSQTSELTGSLVSGVADVQFIGNTLYALITGAGCSHGVPSMPNGIIRVKRNGTWTLVANLSQFYKTHPTLRPEEDDFEPDGTPYSMTNVGRALFVVEPNHGSLDKVEPEEGTVERIIDISASQGHIVPTSVAVRGGHFFIGNLNTFPIVSGSSNIYDVNKNGKQIKVAFQGFTTVLGVAFDRKGRLYVLENTTGGNSDPTPGFGTITRVYKNRERETIATGLNLPTAMTFGPDGKLYVSNWGFGPPPVGMGQILKIDVPNGHGPKDDGDDNDD